MEYCSQNKSFPNIHPVGFIGNAKPANISKQLPRRSNILPPLVKKKLFIEDAPGSYVISRVKDI